MSKLPNDLWSIIISFLNLPTLTSLRSLSPLFESLVYQHGSIKDVPITDIYNAIGLVSVVKNISFSIKSEDWTGCDPGITKQIMNKVTVLKVTDRLNNGAFVANFSNQLVNVHTVIVCSLQLCPRLDKLSKLRELEIRDTVWDNSLEGCTNKSTPIKPIVY